MSQCQASLVSDPVDEGSSIALLISNKAGFQESRVPSRVPTVQFVFHPSPMMCSLFTTENQITR